jgi:multicomponent Na+:H+ antiporter subunit B
MTDRARAAIMVATGAALFALGLWGVAGLPAFGHYPGPYGDVLNTVAPHERKIPNIVTAVNFDYRGLDTLGEEYVFFAAVAGIALVLRGDRKRATMKALPSPRKLDGPPATDAVRAFTALALALTVAFGSYLAIHAAQTPGGGFQGGAILGGFAALLFVGLGYRVLRTMVVQAPVEALKAAGAGGYALIGIATLAASGAFLKNVLPLGGEGRLFSAGTIALINLCVGVEVCAGFCLLVLEFAAETRVEVPEEKT